MPVPPKTRMPLRYRAQYSDRVSVYRKPEERLTNHSRITIRAAWMIVVPGARSLPCYGTFDEAIHEAHRLAKVRAERENPSGEHPPIATIQALMQAAWA